MEFAGFYLEDANALCEVTRLAAYYNTDVCLPATAINLSLETIDGLSKNIATDGESALPFTAVDTTTEGCGPIEFTLSYSPPSTTP